MPLIELPRRFTDEREVKRGADLSRKIHEMVQDYIAQGRTPIEVRVSQDVADLMVAYFSSWARFDGVLPRHVHGVPFYVGGTGGSDMDIKLPGKH